VQSTSHSLVLRPVVGDVTSLCYSWMPEMWRNLLMG